VGLNPHDFSAYVLMERTAVLHVTAVFNNKLGTVTILKLVKLKKFVGHEMSV
jgi:hypothetical protein